ncbi:unnamed protein product [Blepharisma stoltei]|uniref:Uncharacterized protein n=1 Tax=Blepharisma stoltei TaxID=1481888 RepID=A0AAU9J7V6_9CILI|nr:unnamed protein product [Blepharisma stoltei]
MQQASNQAKQRLNPQSPTKPQMHDHTIDRGFIYDITKTNSSNQSWEEIKVTFVKPDHTSFSEYLVFDKTQEDLNESIEEVMNCISESLYETDRQILVSYLSDIMRLGTIKKDKDILSSSSKSARDIEYDEKNAEIAKSFYSGINREAVSKEIKKHINWITIEEKEDTVNQAFELIRAQKLQLQIELHDIFINERETKRKTPFKTPGETDDKNCGEIEKRLEEIINRREANNESKTEVKHSSCLGKGPEWFNACQCAII